MKPEPIILRKDHIFEKCPNCGVVGKLRHSRPKNLLENISKLGIWDYFRCRECGWRGKRISISLKSISIKTILFYLFLMLATAVIVRFVIQKFAMK